MEIQQLEEFVSLVETCSFQRTAEEVNVSQSALTKHIQKLEEELGVTFFDRSTRSVKTNAYSRAFYPYAKQALQFFQEGRRELSSLTNQNKWVLRVAYSPGSARYGVIELLSAFSRENPQFSLQTQESHQVTELLYGRQCDFAFATEEALPDRQMNQIVYETDRLAVILPDSILWTAPHRGLQRLTVLRDAPPGIPTRRSPPVRPARYTLKHKTW